MLTVEEFKNSYDWSEAWNVSLPNKLAANYTMDNIVEILASDEGENDGPNWLALLQMDDGNVIYLNAGCDYTGWDCQAGGFRDAATLEHWMGPLGLSDESQQRLFGNE